MINNSTIFDDTKIFPYRSPHKNSAILDLPHFWKLPKGHEVALISFTTWRTSRDYSIKKIHVYATIRYHPVAPGLNPVNCEHSIHLSIAFIFWQENFFKIYGEVLFLNSYNKSHFSKYLNSVFFQKSINKKRGLWKWELQHNT